MDTRATGGEGRRTGLNAPTVQHGVACSKGGDDPSQGLCGEFDSPRLHKQVTLNLRYDDIRRVRILAVIVIGRVCARSAPIGGWPGRGEPWNLGRSSTDRTPTKPGAVAQQARASLWHGEGRRFDSGRAPQGGGAV